MKKTALLLIIISIISSCFGFFRDITLSYFYGTSNISDVYLISLTIPNVIFGFIGVGISTGYIPMYSKIQRDFGENAANRFTNNLIHILLVISTVIIILGLLFTEQIVKLFAYGFGGNTLTLAVRFTKISLICIYFTGILFIYRGFLQIKGNFIAPALIGFPLNFIIILSIIISAKTDTVVLIIGSVAATASQLLLLILFIHKKGLGYKFVINFKDEHIKNMAYIAMPIIIGLSVNQINILVDRTIASSIAAGGISALHYAHTVSSFVQGIFVLSLSTAMYPLISKMAAENNINGLKTHLSEAISGITLLVIPATMGAMIFAEPIVRLLFGRGAFDEQAISITSYALFFYAIGMIGIGLREVLSRAFYSLQDSKTPMINAAIAMTMNIILNFILSKFFGIGGLALATSISAVFCTILLIISLRKKIGSFGMRNIIKSFIKILSASLVMGIIAKIMYNFLLYRLNGNLSLVATIGIAALVYFILIYFMKIKDVDAIVDAIKRKFAKDNV